jgi:hypothetical protein
MKSYYQLSAAAASLYICRSGNKYRPLSGQLLVEIEDEGAMYSGDDCADLQRAGCTLTGQVSAAPGLSSLVSQ